MKNEFPVKRNRLALTEFDVGRSMFKMHAPLDPAWTSEMLRGYNSASWAMIRAVSAESPAAALALCDAMMEV